MNKRLITCLPWVLWTLAMLLNVVQIVLLFLSNFQGLLDGLLLMPAMLIFLTVGTLVAWRHPCNPLGWILCMGTTIMLGSEAAGAYTTYTLLVAPGRFPCPRGLHRTSTGTPIIPRNLVREFKALLERVALPPIRFHDLRHSCASLLAANGVPVRVAMDVLGHANITTTQNVYTHVFDNAKRQAAEVMERVFSGQQHEA